MNPCQVAETKNRVATHIEMLMRGKPTAHTLRPLTIVTIQSRRKNGQKQFLGLITHDCRFNIFDRHFWNWFVLHCSIGTGRPNQ